MTKSKHKLTKKKSLIRRVFISYAREDLTWAKEMYRIARSLGLDVFIDVEGIRAGDDYPAVLDDELEKADLVWLGWSKYASQSPWVRHEYLVGLNKEQGQLRIDFLDKTALPDELKHIQAEVSLLSQIPTENLLRNPFRELPAKTRQPSLLLRPEYGVVPFYGREAELAGLRKWCKSDALFSMQLITGPGGVGKSRMLIELCKRLEDEGWETGFLDAESFNEALVSAPQIIDKLFFPRISRLIVIDYAETRRFQVEALLRRATDKKAGKQIRLVLIARSASDWWTELGKSQFELQQLRINSPEPLLLPPLADRDISRQAVFERALASFASRLGVQPETEPIPDLSKDVFRNVLFIHLAALSSALGTQLDQPTELLAFIIDHEQRYWQRMAESNGLEASHHGSLPIAATLLILIGGSRTISELASVYSHHAEYFGERIGDCKLFARVFANLYSAVGKIEPLQPNILGEQLVYFVFSKEPEMITSWMEGLNPLQVKNGLTILNRIADRFSEAEEWIAQALSSNLDQLAEVAMNIAIETGDPMGRILAATLTSHPNPKLALRIEAMIPHETTALRELALVVSYQALTHLFNSRSSPAIFPRLLANLSLRLDQLGHTEAALSAIEQAVSGYRQLVEEQKEAYLPALALSLNNLGHSLSKLGQREKALAAIEEANSIFRQLSQGQPESFTADLAMGLNSLGVVLSELNRSEEGLAAIRESVRLRRQLAEKKPQTFLPDLAGSLNNMGNRLSELGERERALAAAEEAVSIYRQLAERDPDAFLPDLALGLHNLGVSLSEGGRSEEAFAAAEEAVHIRRRLVEKRPRAFLADLATSLTSVSNRLRELGRREDALVMIVEASSVFRQLAQDLPETFLPHLARSLNNLGGMLAENKRWEEARGSAEEAISINQKLVQERPEIFISHLAASLTTLGISLRGLGRHEQALSKLEEAINLYRQLAEKRPEVYEPSLAIGLNGIAVLLSELGRREEAMAAVEEAVNILLPFFEMNPRAYSERMTMITRNYYRIGATS